MISRASTVSALILLLFLFILSATAYAGAISNIAAVNGTEVSYEIQGTGPALVLLNDGILDKRMWDDQVKAFAAHYRVIRYDFRGWGRSSPPQEPFSPVDDLHALLTFLRIEKVALIGSFVGGGVAIDFAIEHPEMVSSVVVATPLLHGFRYSEATESWSQTWYAVARADDKDRLLHLFMDNPTLGKRLKDIPPVRQRLETMLLDNFAVYRTDFSRLLLGADPPALRLLPAVRTPTLIVAGENVNPDLRIIMEMLQRGVRDARHITIPQTGQLANIERPEEFNRIVLEWLSKHAHEGEKFVSM
ncbi:MAG: alpha/beta fold hydrolase [Deltaproteobacteria bacterium]|nr:alpha/beta fold hydrolase [Deltaproteobacteria bacterium]